MSWRRQPSDAAIPPNDIVQTSNAAANADPPRPPVRGTDAPGPSAPARRGFLRVGLALFFLNLVLTLSATPAAPWVRPALAVSPDLLALVLLGALAPAAWLRLPRRFSAPFAVALVGAAAARFGGLVALELLGRPLDPAGDLPHLGRVAGMLAQTLPGAGLVTAVLAAAVVAAGLPVLAWWSLRVLGAAGARLSRRRRLAAGLLALALLATPAARPPGGSAVLAAFGILAAPWAETAPDLPEPPLPGVPALGGADLYLIFVESYGAAAFEEPQRRARLREATDRLAADAAAGGFDFRSAQIQSPTFGGGSWRAHASLLSGVWVDREARYRALLASDRVSLVRLFGEAGYRTVAFEPGIRGDWPDGDWYGFDRIYDRDGLDYRGPPIGWWKVPDQFTLHALHQREIRGASRPLFAKVSLILSHIPYWPVPPYVEPWSRFDSGTAYEGPLRSVAHDDYRDLAELSERYALGLEHQFRILGGFLRGFVPRRALVVVLGDHQPPKLALHDSDTWAAPIHLFSRDPALLSPFESLGFTRSLVPLAGSSWRMSDFPRDLAALFPGGADR